jgi:general L-amino acid transport system substrate-binding protein
MAIGLAVALSRYRADAGGRPRRREGARPARVSKEPFSPAARQGDEQFADIVCWTLFAMIEAEEYGITSKNADEMLKSSHPTIKNMLGVTPGLGKALGVDEKWVYDIVRQVGNCGERYDRTLGDGSPLKIARSLNALRTKAGILYAPPLL